MRILLDTHAFLWWIMRDSRLSTRAHAAIRSKTDGVFLSAASGWEIAIKVALGRLQLPQAPGTYIARQLAMNAIESLPILMSHALHVYSLPAHHGDPFDRLLVAQSQLERLPIVTKDPLIRKYDVKVIW